MIVGDQDQGHTAGVDLGETEATVVRETGAEAVRGTTEGTAEEAAAEAEEEGVEREAKKEIVGIEAGVEIRIRMILEVKRRIERAVTMKGGVIRIRVGVIVKSIGKVRRRETREVRVTTEKIEEAEVMIKENKAETD